MNIQLSIHENCRWNGSGSFHIRALIEDEAMKPLMEKVLYHAISDEDEYFAHGGIFSHGRSVFHIENGEFGNAPVAEPTIADIAYVDLRVNLTWLHLRPYQGGWIIDFSMDKDYGYEENLNYTRWMDSEAENKLPMCFWVEPAAIIRSILDQTH